MNPAKADGIIYRQKNSDYYADLEWLVNRTVYVKRFGAVGDGITNDAPAIRRMISFLPQKDFIVRFENAKYMQETAVLQKDMHWVQILKQEQLNILEEKIEKAI